MMDFSGSELQTEFQAVFGYPITDLNSSQIGWLVKVIKHCRGRCRNNAALYSYLRRNFTGHNFKEVPVEGQDYSRLEITPKDSRNS